MNRSLVRGLGALALGLLAFASCSTTGSGAEDGVVPFPDGYRHWTHVKSMVLQEGHPLFDAFGGIHHVYANDIALETLERGDGKWRDGAVFVFDLLEAQAADQAIVEGPRKVVGVMHRDADAFASTGGWGFAGFPAGSRENAISDPANQCFTCHASEAAANGYVFSQLRP